MVNDSVVSFRQPEAFHDSLTALLREKAHGLLRQAIAIWSRRNATDIGWTTASAASPLP